MKQWIALGLGAATVALWLGYRATFDAPVPPPLVERPAAAGASASSPAVAPAQPAVSQRSPDAPTGSDEPPARRSYEEMKVAAGFELHSELANTGVGTLDAYLRQFLNGNIQDEEFIGAACWHLAVRAASNLGYGNNDHRSPQYRRTAYYTVVAATALQDSGPVRHVVQNYLGIRGREEMGIALAKWAIANFEDDSTENLVRFVATMENSATRRDNPLDEDKITEVLSWLYHFQDTLPRPSSAMPREEVPRA